MYIYDYTYRLSSNLAYNNFRVDICSHFFILKFRLSGKGVYIQPVQKHFVIASARVDILGGMDVGVDKTRHQELAVFSVHVQMMHAGTKYMHTYVTYTSYTCMYHYTLADMCKPCVNKRPCQ